MSTNIKKMNKITSHLKSLKITKYNDIGNLDPGFGQAQYVAGFNWSMGSKPSSLVIVFIYAFLNDIVFDLYSP
jgi:hypothetical protein